MQTESEPLQPRLQQAQRTLQKALDEACALDLSKVDTGELIRIEETLATASQAAKEAVSVRLRMRTERARPPAQGERAEDAQQAVQEESGEPLGHRIFEDVRGVRWHAFAVRSTAAAERAGLPDSFRQGWLVFESEHEIRRIAPVPDQWDELAADELRELCHRAAPAPRRVGTPGQQPDG